MGQQRQTAPESGQWTLLSSQETVEEFIRVLNNPMHFTDLKGSRALTRWEKEFLVSYFGSSLEVDRINVRTGIGRRAYSLYGNTVRLPARFFQGHNAAYEIDLSDPHCAAVLAHEAAHVWQRQHGIYVTLKGFVLQCGGLLGIDPYHYDWSLVDPASVLTLFQHGNIERQGQMVQDFVFGDLTECDTAKFSHMRQYLCTQ